MFPILNPPSHLPSHTIPLGHPTAPAPSILYPTSNLDWRFFSYMILYMFQCYSPKSSPPLQSPKDCSIHLRIDAFKLWWWIRLLRVPWTARRSNQSILKDINPECSLEGLVLRLKLQCFGHLIRRANSLEKTMVLGKIEDKKTRER